MKFFVLATILTATLFINSCQSPIESKGSPVVTPALVSPPDHDTTVSLAPIFYWNNTAQIFEISKSPGFYQLTYSEYVNGTTCTLPEGLLEPYTYYYWRAGTISSGSTFWSSDIYCFRTGGN